MVLPLSYRISWRCLSLVSICWAPWFGWIPCVGLWFQKILLNFFANCCRLLVFGTRHFHHFIIPSVVWPWKLDLQHCEDKSELITIEDGGEIKDLPLPESIFLSTITVGDSLPVSLRSSLTVTCTFSGFSCTNSVRWRQKQTEKWFLEISQNSQENTCTRVSFLIMLPVNFLKFLKTPFLQNTSARQLLWRLFFEKAQSHFHRISCHPERF